MAKISDVLRSFSDDCVSFLCPACKVSHVISIGPEGWMWNGNKDKPTFSPSVLVRNGHYIPSIGSDVGCWCTYYADHPEEEKFFSCGICHSYVTDGMIMFLHDCTHSLAGQSVPLSIYE